VQWRGFRRVQIQEYLTCAIQSVQALVRYGPSSKKSPLVILQQIKQIITQAIQAGSYAITSLLPRIPSENAHVFVGHRNWSLAAFE
jgi:hypothetical protein